MIQTGEELGQRQDDILAETEKKRTMADAMEAKKIGKVLTVTTL